MKKKWEISRRTFLQGSGVSIALPVLEAMLPTIAAAEAMGAPKRLVYVYASIGIQMDSWTPATATLDTLPSTLSPLAPYKSHLLVINGLDNTPAVPSGAGDHASSGGAFLTGVKPNKSTSTIRAGISVDQLAVNAMTSPTKVSSLNLSGESGGNSGDCDSGYSCAYTNNLSWISATTPNTKEVSPLAIFNRLFSGTNTNQTAQQELKRIRYKTSILDYALASATSLKNRLGRSDKMKIDEHMAGIRDLERRITASQPVTNSCNPGTAPVATSPNYETQIKLLYDLLAMAFQCDVTRVATFLMTNEGSNRSYPFLNFSDGHHSLSHEPDSEGFGAYDPAKLRAIDKWRVEQLAYFVGKLNAMSDANGKVLDNSMIVFGSGLHYRSHSHNDLPIIVVGKGAGTITTNRMINANVPLSNLHLALLQRMGGTQTSFGNSTGALNIG